VEKSGIMVSRIIQLLFFLSCALKLIFIEESLSKDYSAFSTFLYFEDTKEIKLLSGSARHYDGVLIDYFLGGLKDRALKFSTWKTKVNPRVVYTSDNTTFFYFEKKLRRENS